MYKNLYSKTINRIIASVIFMMISFSGSVMAQSWRIYDGSVLPNATVPVFSESSGTYQATENVIVDDIDVPGNKYLWMDVNGTPQSAFLWRMNFASQNVTVTDLTVVMRVRGHADRDLAIDLDMHYNDIRSRITVHTLTKLLRIRNGSGTNVTLGETYDPTTWNTYRFTMSATQTNLYINEDPTPALTFTPATSASANRHFRFGDGDSGASFGADIDWIVWDVSGAYAPGEGAAIPVPVVAPSWDATLLELKADDVDITGFSADVLTYDIALPAGTTDVPVVSALANDPIADVAITQATEIPGNATVVVTAENGITIRTYTIGFRIVSDMATLQQIAVDGDAIAGFDPDVLEYTINLPLETTEDMPVVTATATDSNAEVAITQVTALPGAAVIVVTAEDGVAELTYTVNFQLVSTDAALSDLLVDGVTVTGFDPEVLEYLIFFPEGTTEIPVVTAVSNNENATVEITQATEIPGKVTILVTAEDGETELEYTINLLTGASDATLTDLLVDGETIDGFDPEVTDYFLVLPLGATVIPVISAVANDENAEVEITQATEVPGVATALVTAEDNFTTILYSVHIRNLSDDADLDGLSVDGNSVVGFDSDVLAYEITLPFGTSDVPVVTAVASDEKATVVINAATELPGVTSVVVTAEDEVTVKTYTVEFKLDAEPHNWRMYDASVLPNVHGPAFTPSNTAGAGATNVIIPDPDNAENSFLEFITATNGDNYMWATPLQPETPGVTFIFRVKAANDQSRRVLEFDVHHNGIRERLYINREANRVRLNESIIVGLPTDPPPTGDNKEIPAPEGVSLSDWNIYRLTKSEGNVKLYLNENPVPLVEGNSAVATTNQYFRFGDGNGSHNSAAIIDWIIWDETGAYAPGEGSSIPNPVVSPNWDATLAELRVNGTPVEGFDPEVTEYEIILSAATTEIPVITAVVNYASASVEIEQPTEVFGTGTVEVTAFNGFTVISYVITFVSDEVSVGEIAARDFRLYPNPATTHINVELAEGLSGRTLQIINTAGQVVLSRNIDFSREIIDVSFLNQGVYIVNIISEQGQARQLFIKK